MSINSRTPLSFLFALLAVLVTGPSAFAADNDSILKNLHKVSTIASMARGI
jgi:hypothetical protein